MAVEYEDTDTQRVYEKRCIMKRILTIVVTFILAAAAVGLTACGRAAAIPERTRLGITDPDEMVFIKEAAMEEAAAAYEMDAAAGMSVGFNGESGSVSVANPGRKLIRNVNLSLESKDYDNFTSSVIEKIRVLGGYVENSSSSSPSVSSDSAYRYARNMNITARIPADRLDAFVDGVCAESNLTYKSENVDDVTLQYSDTESRKKSLVEEQNRLNELMKKAETVEDLIKIEERLSEVRYQLESIESQLRTYDNQVDYSTVYLDITEVVDYTPQQEATLGEKISEGFSGCIHGLGRFFAGLFVFIISYSPVLILLAAVVTGVVFLVKKKSSKAQDSKAQDSKAQDSKAQDGKAQDGNEGDGKEQDS